MKTAKSLLFVFAVMLTAMSCKSTGKGSVTASKFSTNENYRVVISFISIGQGIDGRAYDAITKFIDEHPKKPLKESYRWGREGEIDYCLQLKELTAKEQKAFIEEVKKLTGKNDLVLISENTPCVHKK